jgi:hypothetical protein
MLSFKCNWICDSYCRYWVYLEVPLLSTLMLDILAPPMDPSLVSVIACLDCFIKIFFQRVADKYLVDCGSQLAS